MEQIRVLSFGQALAGNVCAMTLAELGAEVVKIEAPSRPDNLRMRMFPDHPPVHEPSGADTTALYGGTARSTRGLTLDLKSDVGKEIFKRLIPAADVVLENFGPGVMQGWGLGYEQMSELNPRIVVLSISGFGKGGPRGNYLAYGGNICSFIGLTQLWGYSHGAHHDYVAAAHGAFAILAALIYRDLNGTGTFIDLAQTEAGAAVMGPVYLDFLVNNEDQTPRGNSEPTALISDVFRCSGEDRWIAIEIRSEADLLKIADLVGDPKPQGSDVDGVHDALGNWAKSLTPHQALIHLQRAGVAAGVVQQGEDLYRDPQLRSRGFIAEVNHPDLGAIEYPMPPHWMSATPARIKGHAPRLGQDTGDVLREWIGVTEPEIAHLKAAGIV